MPRPAGRLHNGRIQGRVNASPRGEPLLPHTILAVDDDRPIRVLLKQLLEAEGHEVVTAEDAAAALHACDKASFSVVVSDVVMPGLSGIDLREELSRRHPRLPVILISGHDIDHARNYSLDAPMTAFLPKPFDPVELIALIHQNARSFITS